MTMAAAAGHLAGAVGALQTRDVKQMTSSAFSAVSLTIGGGFKPAETVYVAPVGQPGARNVCGGGWRGAEVHLHGDVGDEAVIHELIDKREALAGGNDRPIGRLEGGAMLRDDIGLAFRKDGSVGDGEESEGRSDNRDEGAHLWSGDFK